MVQKQPADYFKSTRCAFMVGVQDKMANEYLSWNGIYKLANQTHLRF